jgi:hypothetical protein
VLAAGRRAGRAGSRQVSEVDAAVAAGLRHEQLVPGGTLVTSGQIAEEHIPVHASTVLRAALIVFRNN